MINWNKTAEQRPRDGQQILYYFEPFYAFATGRYCMETDSVSGGRGFTSMYPEVEYWVCLSELLKTLPE